MPIKPPLTDLPIKTADRGFYQGFTTGVTLPSKLIVSALIIWAVAFPNNAIALLNEVNSFILANFASWYVWSVALFLSVCVGLAIWPAAGRLKLGRAEDEPEFSRFSWFAMMFGAGIGVGMLRWAVAEPSYHFNNNPDVIMGLANAANSDNVRNAYKWSYLHWGLGAFACYAIVGLALAFFAYRRNLPLTIRSSLSPLFGKSLSGPLGHTIDVVAVVATILGVAQALGFGVEQFVSGLHRIGFGNWLLNAQGAPSTTATIFSIVVIMGISTISVLSGVGKGIRWLSNINMVLSIFLLLFFLIVGSTWFGLSALLYGIVDYLVALPELMFKVWQGDWSVFYWAWWIAFAPFVGVFLARISKGRTIREFVIGAVVAPSLMSFIWFAWAGGTAIDLELNGAANGAINAVADGAKIFVIADILLSPTLAWLMAIVIMVLLTTYLVTSADSAVLIVNTINAAGDEGPKARLHILFWGVSLGLIVAVLLLVGGLKAIQTAMVIGALPFSVVMVLMCIALVKAIYREGMREKHEAV